MGPQVLSFLEVILANGTRVTSHKLSKIVPFDINSMGFQPYMISFAITELTGNVVPFIYLHLLVLNYGHLFKRFRLKFSCLNPERMFITQ